MARIERSINIDAAPADVFEVLTDLDLILHWATIVVANHDVPEKPLRARHRFRQTVSVAGIKLETDWEVLELERPNFVVYRVSVHGGGRLDMRQTVTPTDGGCEVTIDADYDLPGGILGDLVNRVYVEQRNEREAEASLKNLKAFVEARQAGHTSPDMAGGGAE